MSTIRAAEFPSVLQELFAALLSRGVLWALLRVPATPAAPSGDVDVLFAAEDLAVLRDAACELGFVALPASDSPPNLTLLRYDPASGCWLLVDAVTSVTFRRPANWRAPGDAAARVLGHRQIRHGLAMPADGDAFWLLLLHCLLDRGFVAVHYRETLRALAPSHEDSPLGRAALTAAGPGWEPGLLATAARQGDWERLGALSGPLVAEMKRRRAAPARARAAGERLARLARKPRLLSRRRGVSLALMGPNGVGKSTVASAVSDDFPLPSRVIHMGLWKGGRPSLEVAAPLLRPLRIWRRYLVAQYHLMRGRLVIFDRYVYEATLPPQPPFVGAKRRYFWLLAHAVPPPDATVVLDVPGAVAYRRKQENPPGELEAERRVYRRLATRVPRTEIVDASRDLAAVRADVGAIVWRRYRSRWAGAGR